MQGRGGVTRGNATTIRHVDERRRCDERQCEVEAAQREVTRQPARENERQMGRRRRRLRLKRQRHDENGTTRANATTSQGKQEGGMKASATRWRVDESKVPARLPQRRLEVGGGAIGKRFLLNHAHESWRRRRRRRGGGRQKQCPSRPRGSGGPRRWLRWQVGLWPQRFWQRPRRWRRGTLQ